VTVGESTRLATAAFSRYSNRTVVYPSPLLNPLDCIDFLQRHIARHDYRMVLPMEYETLSLMAQNHDAFSRYAYLPVVSHATLHRAQDKGEMLRLADHLGIPTPRTWHIDDLSRIHVLKDRFNYPVVIKPRKAAGAMGVCYPETAAELETQYLSVHRRFPYPMIQEYIPREGPGYGASFLFDEKGRVKASFVHKRLREYPVTGGASTLRESVRYDDIRDMAQSLLQALGWFGVAMVEFKVDPRDGTPKLMEINPRFWGSLALAVTAGVNFPYLLYRMSCGEDFSPVERYPVGVRCRWLLPGDMLHFIYNPERRSLIPRFFRLFEKDTAYDILSATDPLPALARVLTPVTFLYDPDMQERLKRRKE